MKESKTYISQLFGNVCQNDSRQSFEDIFKLFYKKLFKFSVHYIKDREAAEEIISDILFKLWMKRKELSRVQDLENYLFIMVKNQSLNYLKQFSNFRVVYLTETGDHQLLNTDDPQKELERRELIFQMNRAIDALPQQCKIIFNLVKEEGLKYKDVAQILDISPRTVESQLVRAMQKLDKLLSPYILGHNAPPKRKAKTITAIRSILFSILS